MVQHNLLQDRTQPFLNALADDTFDTAPRTRGPLPDIVLRLAGWADERCRAAGPDLLDERATHGTRLAFAVSDQEFREVPRLVVQVLLECQATQLQCMSKL